MERSGRRVMEMGARISLYGFRLAGLQRSDWLASQPSDWSAFSAPIGHNYTLVYAVVMYSSLYSVYNVITHFYSHSITLASIPLPETHNLFPRSL